jgi:hypothetical protein
MAKTMIAPTIRLAGMPIVAMDAALAPFPSRNELSRRRLLPDPVWRL